MSLALVLELIVAPASLLVDTDVDDDDNNSDDDDDDERDWSMLAWSSMLGDGENDERSDA